VRGQKKKSKERGLPSAWQALWQALVRFGGPTSCFCKLESPDFHRPYSFIPPTHGRNTVFFRTQTRITQTTETFKNALVAIICYCSLCKFVVNFIILFHHFILLPNVIRLKLIANKWCLFSLRINVINEIRCGQVMKLFCGRNRCCPDF
jgi:hypothetical protein